MAPVSLVLAGRALLDPSVSLVHRVRRVYLLNPLWVLGHWSPFIHRTHGFLFFALISSLLFVCLRISMRICSLSVVVRVEAATMSRMHFRLSVCTFIGRCGPRAGVLRVCHRCLFAGFPVFFPSSSVFTVPMFSAVVMLVCPIAVCTRCSRVACVSCMLCCTRPV
jgi:hypothetical protein